LNGSVAGMPLLQLSDMSPSFDDSFNISIDKFGVELMQTPLCENIKFQNMKCMHMHIKW
jgi:hypothetical protein